MQAVVSAPALAPGTYQAVAACTSVPGVDMQPVEELCEPGEPGEDIDMVQNVAGGTGDALSSGAGQTLEEEVMIMMLLCLKKQYGRRAGSQGEKRIVERQAGRDLGYNIARAPVVTN